MNLTVFIVYLVLMGTMFGLGYALGTNVVGVVQQPDRNQTYTPPPKLGDAVLVTDDGDYDPPAPEEDVNDARPVINFGAILGEK